MIKITKLFIFILLSFLLGNMSTVNATEVTDSVTVTVVTNYTLTINKIGSGNVSGAGTYSAGQVVTMTATPSSGYTFSGWSGDSDCTDGTVTMNSSKSCTATFSAASTYYTVSVSASTGCAVSPLGSNQVVSGGSLLVNTASSPNYRTNSLVVDGVTQSAIGQTYLFSNVTSNHSLSMNCSLVQHVVTKSGGPNGTITLPNGAGNYMVDHGSTVNLTVVPNSGYTASASGCGGSLSGTTYTTGPITSACTVTATFTSSAVPTYTLSINKTGTGSGYVSGTGTYPSGTSVSMTASAYSGSVFSGWSGNSDCTDGSVTMTSNKSCTATFTATATTSGTLNTYDCSIASGSSGCNVSISWNITNPVGPSSVTFPVGNVLSTSSSGSTSSYLSKGSRTYYLYDNGSLLRTSTATADCTYLTSWDSASGTCKPVSSGVDLTVDTTNTSGSYFDINTPVNFFSYVNNSGSSSANNFTVLFQTGTYVDGFGNITNPREYTAPNISTSAMSNSYVSKNITFDTPGIKYIRTCADKSSSADIVGVISETNENNNCGAWKTITIISSPTAPTITGNVTFAKDTLQTFVITGTDPSGDTIRYGIDWDNNSIADYWSPYYSSGYSLISPTHSWSSVGSNSFKALTQNSYGSNSSWTTFNFTVTLPAIPASITSFTANKTQLDFGEFVTLTWTSTNSTSCSMSSSPSPSVSITSLAPNTTNNNIKFNPNKTTIYSLVCTGPGGSSPVSQLTVNVGDIKPNYNEF